jgi:hypothetical protein
MDYYEFDESAFQRETTEEAVGQGDCVFNAFGGNDLR